MHSLDATYAQWLHDSRSMRLGLNQSPLSYKTWRILSSDDETWLKFGVAFSRIIKNDGLHAPKREGEELHHRFKDLDLIDLYKYLTTRLRKGVRCWICS